MTPKVLERIKQIIREEHSHGRNADEITKCILIVFCPGELPQWNARGKIKKIVVEELSKMQ